MRRLFGLLAALAVFAVPASMASAAETPPSGESPVAVEPEEIVVEPGEIVVESGEGTSKADGELVPAPSDAITPFSLSQCDPNKMCAWQNNNYTGTFSWWWQSDTGCHDHAGNPHLRSFWNRTAYTVRLGGWGNLPSGWQEYVNLGAVAGQICWPV